jgi:hypothetical protein
MTFSYMYVILFGVLLKAESETRLREDYLCRKGPKKQK